MKCFDHRCLLQVQIKALVKFRRVQSVEENSRSFQFNYEDCEASQINVWFGWESVNIENLYLENHEALYGYFRRNRRREDHRRKNEDLKVEAKI